MLKKLSICIFIYLNCWGYSWGQSNIESHEINIKSNPPGAIVYIEGSMVGIAPCKLSFDLFGKYRIRAFKKGYNNWKRTINFGEKNNDTVNIMLSPKTRFKAAARSLIFPGWGQTYSDKKTKGKIIKILIATSIFSTVYFEVNYQEAVNDHNDALKDYNDNKMNFEAKNIYWVTVEENYNNVNSSYKTRNILLLTTGAIWLYSIFDAIFTFPNYYEQILMKKPLNLSFQNFDNNYQIMISKTFYLN